MSLDGHGIREFAVFDDAHDVLGELGFNPGDEGLWDLIVLRSNDNALFLLIGRDFFIGVDGLADLVEDLLEGLELHLGVVNVVQSLAKVAFVVRVPVVVVLVLFVVVVVIRSIVDELVVATAV